MRSCLITALVAVLIPSSAVSQGLAKTSAPVSQVEASSLGPTLHLANSVRSSVAGPPFNRVACDSTGKLYLRRYQGPKAQSPVDVVSPTGVLITSLQVENPNTFTISDFYIDQKDLLYMLGWSTEHVHSGSRVYVISFGQDGSMKSKIQLVPGSFFPSSLAVFGSGEFLVTGRQGPHDNSPFTGVFNRNGGLIAEINVPEDEELRRKAEEGDSTVQEPGIYGNTAVSMGTAVSGSDGNVYVMRRAYPALIYVVSPKGEVLRKLRIDPGNSGLRPRELQFSNDRLAIWFVGSEHDRLLKVVDAVGNEVAEYQMPIGWVGPLACYNPPLFTFLRQDGDDSGIIHIDRFEAK